MPNTKLSRLSLRFLLLLLYANQKETQIFDKGQLSSVHIHKEAQALVLFPVCFPVSHHQEGRTRCNKNHK